MSRKRLTAALAAAALLISGCGVTVEDLPLPGGEVEGPSYELKAVFADALNLPGKAKVRLGGVDIGVVENIETRNYVAHVVMSISQDVRLPKGTMAQLRQPTPLGDVFVSVEPPDGKLAGPKLADGATIGLESTSTAATVEDSLAAATSLINGGGLGQLQDITRELNMMFEKGGKRVPALLDELRTTMRTLNERTGDIDRLLESMDSVSKLVQKRKGSIDNLLTEYPPAFDVLSRHTEQLTETLAKVGDASEVTLAATQISKDDLKGILDDLGPVLDGFNRIRADLGPTLRDMVAFGKELERNTEGHALAGYATLTDPVVADLGVPDFDDMQDAGEHNIATITELVKRLGVG